MPAWLKKLLWWLLMGFLVLGAITIWVWRKNQLTRERERLLQEKKQAVANHAATMTAIRQEETDLVEEINQKYAAEVAVFEQKEAALEEAANKGPVALATFWNNNILGLN